VSLPISLNTDSQLAIQSFKIDALEQDSGATASQGSVLKAEARTTSSRRRPGRLFVSTRPSPWRKGNLALRRNQEVREIGRLERRKTRVPSCECLGESELPATTGGEADDAPADHHHRKGRGLGYRQARGDVRSELSLRHSDEGRKHSGDHARCRIYTS